MQEITAEKRMPCQEETLRYLGYHGQALSPELEEDVRLCRQEIYREATPRSVWGRFPLRPTRQGIEVSSTTLLLTGKDIAGLLQECEECILMAVTLGGQVERLINYTQQVSMTKALIMDAAATAMIETVCDHLEGSLRTELEKENLALTWRYSCGYGDLPLNLQKDFLSALNAQRRIGLTCSADSIMIPRKSVTAVMGIGRERNRKPPTCETCPYKESCQLRKAGKSCGR